MTKSDYLKYLKKKEVFGKPIVDKIGKLNKFYLPLSEWIYSIYSKDFKPKIIGLSGGQGAGKSTITGILKLILKKKYGLNICVFSIDDFYKTKNERLRMSQKKHPLFITRGVPGTHDLALLKQTIRKLKQKKFRTVLIPKFDKSKDDRYRKNKWQKIKTKPDIIIFEGWCVGTTHQNNNELKRPINLIEKKYDENLKWRKTVNNLIKKRYKNIFNKIDKLVFLKVPHFNYIIKWRWLQEQKMKLTTKSKKTMSKTEVKEFIMFYERLTKHMIKNYSKISDLTIFLDKKHRSRKMIFN
ncbi:uridine kinase [Pelagibacteraceae bacterium]|nr:uridine kinase [Pelagibacteraceae bacterium]